MKGGRVGGARGRASRVETASLSPLIARHERWLVVRKAWSSPERGPGERCDLRAWLVAVKRCGVWSRTRPSGPSPAHLTPGSQHPMGPTTTIRAGQLLRR